MPHRHTFTRRGRARITVLAVGVVAAISGTAVVATAAGATATAVTSPLAGMAYMIVARSSGKAVDDSAWSTSDGTPIVQWTRTGSTNQQFEFVPSDDGWFRIRSVLSGKVLDDTSWLKANGTPIIQYADHDTANQQWKVQAVGSDVELVNRNSGKVLDVTAWSTSDGTALQQYTDDHTANQQWILVPVGAGPAPVTSAPATPVPPTTAPPTTAPPTTAPTAAPPTTTPPMTTAPATPPTSRPTAPPVPPSGGTPAPASGPDQCGAYASVTEGKYWINNNTWGASSGTGSQCINGGNTSGDTISWSTHWNWTGKSNSVKAFASSVMGWHWGVKIPGSGLPVQLSSGKKVDSTWKYNLVPGGANTLDVSYDMWLHTIPNPSYADTPTDEVMVWLNRSGGAGPVGTKQLSVTIDGAVWDLYRGNIGWNVFSFVRETPSTDSSLNLMDFMQDLVGRGWVQNTKYLNSVESGTEVFTGTGRLDTLAYNTTVH